VTLAFLSPPLRLSSPSADGCNLFDRLEQHAENVGWKDERQMPLVEPLAVPSDKADANDVREVIEKNLRPNLIELGLVMLVPGMKVFERTSREEMAMFVVSISFDPGEMRAFNEEQTAWLEEPVEFLHHFDGGREVLQHVRTMDRVGVIIREWIRKTQQIMVDVPLLVLPRKAHDPAIHTDGAREFPPAATDIEDGFARHFANEPGADFFGAGK
jgi:hypothetical protein